MARKKVNAEVRARMGEHPERLIKRFLNKVKKERIIEEVMDRRYYETPSQERSRKKNRRRKVLAKLRREREKMDRVDNK